MCRSADECDEVFFSKSEKEIKMANRPSIRSKPRAVKRPEDRIIKVAVKDIGKVCTICGEIKSDTRIRSYAAAVTIGSCGDSFCWASCDLVSCKGRQSVQACDECEKEKR
jgi:hypothetical protein